MKMLDKHKSKLHKGFIKQVIRQDNKLSIVKVKIIPEILSYKDGEYKPLKQKFFNNKWNGINLKDIYLSFIQVQPNWMYSKVRINKEGKYILSIFGKNKLNKLKNKRSNY